MTRLVAGLLWQKSASPFPTERQREDLFPEEWTAETVEKPRHDLSYYLLRITGFAYLGYFFLTLIGLLGVAPWPEQVRTRAASWNPNDRDRLLSSPVHTA